MEDYGHSGQRRTLSHSEFFPQHNFYGADGRRPYPFAGTVLMGALLNIAIFKLSPRTNAAHFMAIGVLGSLGVNSMHAILKLAGHTKDSSMMEMGEFEEEEFSVPHPSREVYDSNIRFLHVLIVKPLSGVTIQVPTYLAVA